MSLSSFSSATSPRDLFPDWTLERKKSMMRAPAGVSKAQSSSSGATDGPPRRETIAVKTDGSEAICVTSRCWMKVGTKFRCYVRRLGRVTCLSPDLSCLQQVLQVSKDKNMNRIQAAARQCCRTRSSVAPITHPRFASTSSSKLSYFCGLRILLTEPEFVPFDREVCWPTVHIVGILILPHY